MPESQEFTRVQGSIKDGHVKCTCDRTVGLVSDTGVEFFCRHCRTNVVVDIRQSKITALMELAKMIHML